MNQEIAPRGPLDARVFAPPSKAHTLRAFFLASLAEGTSRIRYPLLGDDQHYALQALSDLGIKIVYGENEISVTGRKGTFSPLQDTLFVGNSGVSARVLTVFAALSDSDITIDGDERMRSGRPLTDLLDAMRNLGVEAVSVLGNGCPPVLVKGGSFIGGTTTMKGSVSSQYFSAILMAAPCARKEVRLIADGPIVSRPYIDITLGLMEAFGVKVENDHYRSFRVPLARYKAIDLSVEGDYSGAAFFFAAAAIAGGRVTVRGLDRHSWQGDRKFLHYLVQMGCGVVWEKDACTVVGCDLKAIEADMNDTPDLAIPLAVVAAFAKGTSRLSGLGHLRFKECDRLEAPCTELRRMGIKAYSQDDTMFITGGSPIGASIETYGDHRMAMGFAVAGLRARGTIIKDAEVCRKSFPGFFSLLGGLR